MKQGIETYISFSNKVWRDIESHDEHGSIALIGLYWAMATIIVFLSHIVYNQIWMVRSTRGLICLIIVASTVTYIAECGFRKLQSTFNTKRTSLQKCHTCLLKDAGARRLIMMKQSISKLTITITYLIKGPSSFYHNVESLCFGVTKCEIVEIGDYIPSDEEKREAEENHPIRDNAQYLCLIKYAASHSLSCMSSLREISGSEVMWNFLSRDVSLPQIFHLYLLRTSKTLQQNNDVYRVGKACTGSTFALSKDSSDSFVKTIFELDQAPVSSPSSPPYPATAEYRSRFGHQTAHADEPTWLEQVKQTELSLEMSASCFRTKRLGDSSKFCLSCVSSHEKTAIVFMGRDFEHPTFKDSSSRGDYEMPYLYYRFSV